MQRFGFLKELGSTAPDQASQIRTMYVSETRNCVNVSFTFDKKVAEQALLDSGATDNFIDQRTIKRLNIST